MLSPPYTLKSKRAIQGTLKFIGQSLIGQVRPKKPLKSRYRTSQQGFSNCTKLRQSLIGQVRPKKPCTKLRVRPKKPKKSQYSLTRPGFSNQSYIGQVGPKKPQKSPYRPSQHGFSNCTNLEKSLIGQVVLFAPNIAPPEPKLG